MNSSDANYEKILIPRPFASGDGAAYEPVSTTQISNKPNFTDGFPSAFSAPASGGGQYITRAQINAIGRLATQNDFVRNCGKVNTFDPEFCNAIGGYPLGAVLEMLVGTQFFHVVSLKENNDFNFLENGVDGINWAYCNEQYGDTNLDLDVMFSVPNMSASPLDGTWSNSVPGHIFQPLATFKSPRDGLTSFIGSLDFEAFSQETVNQTVSQFAVVLLEGDTTTALSDKGPFDTQGKVVFSRGSGTISSGTVVYDMLKPVIVNLNKGKYYSAWAVMTNCRISNSTVQMKIC